MRINQNSMAINAYRNLSTNNVSLGKSLEKLSSGFRINRAADDAAGLVISQNLRAQVSGLRQATRNAQDGISVVQTAEGALNEVHTILNRMRDLSVQAANSGSNDADARAPLRPRSRADVRGRPDLGQDPVRRHEPARRQLRQDRRPVSAFDADGRSRRRGGHDQRHVAGGSAPSRCARRRTFTARTPPRPSSRPSRRRCRTGNAVDARRRTASRSASTRSAPAAPSPSRTVPRQRSPSLTARAPRWRRRLGGLAASCSRNGHRRRLPGRRQRGDTVSVAIARHRCRDPRHRRPRRHHRRGARRHHGPRLGGLDACRRPVVTSVLSRTVSSR